MKNEFKNLLMDFYELTMGQAYFNKKVCGKIVFFDLFFRKAPDGSGFVIANGVQKCVDYLSQFHFSEEDIDYLKSLGTFSEDYLNYLAKLKFTGDVWAVEDGTVVFANEPMITVKAPLIEAQLVETALLVYFNHNSLITTKASRIVRSANERLVMEFGSRRAQGESAAVDGALDAYIAGAGGTACTETGKEYGVPVLGTMAHSFVQSFETEYDAFKAYAETFPDACTLLVDTFNTLESGIPNAIKVYNDVLKSQNKTLAGIRIDSGDLEILSKQAREMLDEAGLFNTKIVTSNSLDEYSISKLIACGAPIDSFGVGENLITSKSNPVFGGVYKLVAIEQNNEIVPKIKVSDNACKTTNPGFKNLFRFFDNNGKIIADMVCLADEKIPSGKLILKVSENEQVEFEENDYVVQNLRVKMIEQGKVIYKLKSVKEIREKVKTELDTLCDLSKKLENPYKYYVNFSEKLKNLKEKLLDFYAEII